MLLVRTHVRLERATAALAVAATLLRLFRFFVRLIVIRMVLLLVVVVAAAVQIRQHLVAGEVHVVDAVRVNFDGRVQRAARFREVDALFVASVVFVVAVLSSIILIVFLVLPKRDQCFQSGADSTNCPR